MLHYWVTSVELIHGIFKPWSSDLKFERCLLYLPASQVETYYDWVHKIFIWGTGSSASNVAAEWLKLWGYKWFSVITPLLNSTVLRVFLIKPHNAWSSPLLKFRRIWEENSFSIAGKKTYQKEFSSTYYSNFYQDLYRKQLVLISIQFYRMPPQELLAQS